MVKEMRSGMRNEIVRDVEEEIRRHPAEKVAKPLPAER
jgi:hypothetical protein